ncbi:tetratricopeptide repeat protein [Actinomycetospora cinnamomea]|uniref:Tetratricopeptide repeat protein n=1 Tax=Actinomycetospora cinnamomea TaxID=663609 RepID=A0A2U1F7Q2_9PSEU|nr:tetratricopeptide repeat protein [Actinomycetospora cinnamomea]
MSRYATIVDYTLLWTVVGSVAGVGALAAGIVQVRLSRQSQHRRHNNQPSPSVAGGSVSVPTGRLPPEVLGRERVIAFIRDHSRQSPNYIVLTGPGGIGKSTIATELCRVEAEKRWRRFEHIWWISATDKTTLTLGLVTVVKQAGGSVADALSVSNGDADGPDRFWGLLQACGRWLIIFDNADDPSILAGPGQTRHSRPGDATGWLRPSKAGSIVVTTRDNNSSTWGRHATLCDVPPLDLAAATEVLLNLAPDAGPPTDAALLASRLGGFPLALHVVGMYLTYPLARFSSFREYLAAYDANDLRPGLDVGNASHDDPRDNVLETWEVSLDELARRGLKLARPLLRIISCMAPAAPFPAHLLNSLDRSLLPTDTAPQANFDVEIENALAGLLHLGLLSSAPAGGLPCVVIHPAIADAGRAHLESQHETSRARLAYRAAASCIVDAVAHLQFSAPADWPMFSLLTPHLHATLSTVAPHLNHQDLTLLCKAAATTALSYDWSGGLNAATTITESAIPWTATLGEQNPSTLLLRQQAALQLGRRGDWSGSELEFKDIVRRFEDLGAEHKRESLACRHDFARAVAHCGRWNEAEALCRGVATERAAILGIDHVETLATRHHLARSLAAQRKWHEANQLFETLLEAERRTLGDDHIATLASRDALARSLADQGRWTEAEATYREILGSRFEILGVDHPTTLANLAGLARTLEAQDRLREAAVEYERVLEARTRVLGRSHPDTLESSRLLNNVRLRLRSS